MQLLMYLYIFPLNAATALSTRAYGNWVLLAGVVRIIFAISAISLRYGDDQTTYPTLATKAGKREPSKSA